MESKQFQMSNNNMEIWFEFRKLALGAWKWAKVRGYYRIRLVNTAMPHKLESSRGSETLYEGHQCCRDYEGGKWGYLVYYNAAKSYLEILKQKYPGIIIKE